MKIKYIIGAFLLIIGLGSCSETKQESIPSNRTVLVYMIASNLGSNLNQNINDMIAAANKKNLNGGNLVVFYSSSKDEAELFQIKEGNGGVVTRHHIRDYVGQSAISPDVMKGVIQDVVSLFPSDSYGLIMSSHGTAWMPANFNDMLRSFGEENGHWMEIDELAKGIPDHLFDFLLFDACYMASTECVYQLKNKADYIVASPTETLVEGFPYKLILPYFFTKELQLNNVAETFYQYYNAKSGFNQTATVSVTKTSELNELATIIKEILANKTENDLYALPLSEMQVLEHLTYSAPNMLYDLGDFVNKLATKEQYARFETCLEKAIVSKYSTPNAFFAKPYKSYPIVRFSGVSVYVPQETFPKLNEWYKQLDWYKAVYK